MDAWYKDWFNTEEYLNVYRHRNETEAQILVELILNNIKIPSGSSVLDLASGTGRHSILFAQKGYKVTAVDLSEKLLLAAKKLSENASVKINFINADLRHFNINEKFNLAINLFTSFGYFESDKENFKVFETAYNHLKNSGYFILDFFNKNYLKKNLVPLSIDEILNGTLIQERSFEGDRVIKRITISRNGDKNKFYESVRMYSRDELAEAIKEAGFSIKNIFGDFHGNSFDLETSPRIIIIAQK